MQGISWTSIPVHEINNEPHRASVCRRLSPATALLLRRLPSRRLSCGLLPARLLPCSLFRGLLLGGLLLPGLLLRDLLLRRLLRGLAPRFARGRRGLGLLCGRGGRCGCRGGRRDRRSLQWKWIHPSRARP